MSPFAGVVSLHRGSIPNRLAETVASAICRNTGIRRAHIRRTSNAVFAIAKLGGISPDGILFASSSRLDNRVALATALGINAEADESEYIRRVFEAHGDTGISQLLGAFAFAYWDNRNLALTLARDCLGRRSLFYHVGDGIVSFSSHLTILLALPEVPRELDERMLANFLALNHRERETTFYRGIFRVPSRTAVRITRDGKKKSHLLESDSQCAATVFAR